MLEAASRGGGMRPIVVGEATAGEEPLANEGGCARVEGEGVLQEGLKGLVSPAQRKERENGRRTYLLDDDGRDGIKVLGKVLVEHGGNTKDGLALVENLRSGTR